MKTIEEIAEVIWQAEQQRIPHAPVRDYIEALADSTNPSDILKVAYAIQNINTNRRQSAGERLIGRKVGLTSIAVQKQLGVDTPDFGMLFASMAVGHGEVISNTRLLQPKIEAEIAFVLQRDLTHESHTVADIISATAYALPALEVVGSRIENWDIRLADTVADNASSSLFVLGSRPVKLSKLDLIDCNMVMTTGQGEAVSTGVGSACLGNPINAAIWLANMMVKMGSPLKAGDVLMTGALGPMVAVKPGDIFNAHIDGLGSVTAEFGLAM